MPENLGVHVQLTSDSNNFTEAMQKAYRELKEFGNETARMKAQEAALRTTIGNLEKQIASKTAQIEKARARLSELTAAGKENSKTAENLRTKIAAMEKTVEKASASIEKNRAKLRENADTQSKLAAQAEAATREINQQTQAFAKNANQAASTTSQLKNAFTMLKGLALGYAGKTLFNALIGSNADFEQSMTSFDVLLGSAEKAQKMMDDLTKFAAKTPLEMPDVTKATNMLLGYGVAAEDVVEVMGRLGDLAQGNAVRLDRVSLAYGQMLAKGKVTGEELRQMVEAQVPLLQGLADYMEVSTAEVSDMISDGKVGISELNGAIKAMTSEGGQFYGMMEKQAQTMSGLWSTFKDNISIILRETGEGAAEGLKGELSELTASLAQNEAQIQKTANSVGSGIAITVNAVTGLIKLLWDMRGALLAVGAGWAAFRAAGQIQKTLTGLASVWDILLTAMESGLSKQVLSNIATGKTIALKNLETGAITLETAATAKEVLAKEGATVAQLKLNAAMLASPWFWIPAAIIGVTAAISALTTSYEEQKQKLEEVAGEYESISNELTSVQGELKTTADRIDELNGKETLTLTEKDELSNLQASNKELEARVRWLEKEKEIKAELVNYEAIETAKKRFDSKGMGFWDRSLLWERALFTQEGRDDTAAYFSGAQDYEVWAAKIVELQQKINAETDPEKLTKYNASLADYKSKLADARSELDGYAKSITGTDAESVKWKNTLMEQIEGIDKFLYSADELNKIKFDKVFNADDFKESKDALLELAKAGEVTPETIESYDEFNKLIADTGLTAQDIANEINAASEKADNDINNNISSISGLISELENTVNGLEDLNSAYEKVSDGQSLSAGEVENLISLYPDLETAVVKTSDGYTIEKEALEKVAEASGTLKTAHIEAQIEMTRELILQSSERIGIVSEELSAIQSVAEAYALLAGKQIYKQGFIGPLPEGSTRIPDETYDQIVKYGELVENLNAQKDKIKNLKIPTGGGSSRSGGSRDGRSNAEQEAKKAAQEAEKDRQKRVKNYEDANKEEMRLDERWNEQQLKWGKLTEKQFTENLANRANRYREFAEDVLKQDYMTKEERERLHKEYKEAAEDLDIEYFEALKKLAADEIDNDGKAWDKKLQESEDYISERDFYDDWEEHDDTKLEALERYRTKVEDSYNGQKWLVNEYYSQGLMSAEEYYERMEELHEEYKNNLKSINHDIYSEAKEEGAKLIEDTQDALEHYYELEHKFKVSIEYEAYQNKIEETETELAKLEHRHDAKVAEYERRVEELDAQLRAFERGQEDEEDELKRKRLQYLYDYENDDDNKRALLKQMEEVDRQMEEKVLRREVEDARLENDKMTQLYEDERKRMESFLDKKQAAYEKNIEAIDEYYEKVMSPENLMNEMYQTLLENNGLAESIGELMGEQMVEGISKKFDGWIAGAREALESGGLNLGGQRSRGFADNVINNNSKSVNLTQNITGGTDAKQVERVTTRVLNKWEMGAYN